MLPKMPNSDTPAHVISIKIETTTEFCATEVWNGAKVHTQGPQILGATGQNLVARATGATYLCTLDSDYVCCLMVKLAATKRKLSHNRHLVTADLPIFHTKCVWSTSTPNSTIRTPKFIRYHHHYYRTSAVYSTPYKNITLTKARTFPTAITMHQMGRACCTNGEE
jgi:hypothetical protein